MRLSPVLSAFLLGRSLLLFLGQRIPAATTDCVQPNHVLPAQARNGSQQKRFTTCPNTEFPRYIARDTSIRRTAHQTQRFLYPAIRQDVKEGRLPELHC